MKNVAVRLHGKNQISLDTFELPKIRENEILAHVVTDSVCMSTYKAVIQGIEHKRVPNNVDTNPVIIGHEFCGEIIEVGKRWQGKYKVGERFVIQPALNYNSSLDAPGYSYEYIGGDSQYVIIPNEVMETDNLIVYNSDCYFKGSLTEPMSCIIGAFNASYHTEKGKYTHQMGTKPNGKMLILAGCGPMGMGAIDYALNGLDTPPSLLVVTDVNTERINNVKRIFKNNSLVFSDSADKEALLELSGGTGFDDIFVFAPVSELIGLGSNLLSEDGCLNFFAGPTNKDFSANFNFYNVHYAMTHIVGTSGGNCDDMKKAVELMEKGRIDPSVMITHIGGLDSVVETTMNLPNLSGAKKLIYTNIALPLTKIADFEKLSNTDNENAELFQGLSNICKLNDNSWCAEAEKYLLKNAKRINVK
ncbi:MAG: zinc-binding dehydrogenase [Clostridia bacterium]|nr:zinc-binding dehydrogenase [Clostridia bacterium]